MTPSEWKPTDEMIGLAIKAAPGAYDEPVIDILIAVQPLIAEEAKAKALMEAIAKVNAARFGEADNDLRSISDAIRSLIPHNAGVPI